PHTSHLTTAGLDRKRLLMWIIAWCGLSAAW
ncbi:aminoglycoside phosphotransferase family protein, partial [Escherichia coli]